MEHIKQVDDDRRMMTGQHTSPCTNLSQGLVEIVIRAHGIEFLVIKASPSWK